MAHSARLTHLLQAYSEGDRSAGDKLFELVYDELRAIAHRQLLYRRPGRTIGTVELVHETYLKMIQQEEVSWQDRAHFLAVASRAMRHILVDYARRQKAQKRGGKSHRTTLNGSLLYADDSPVDILDLEVALSELTKLNPRLGQVVELRFYGGLSVEEAARVLGVSSRTIDRDWFKARAFLYRLLEELDPAR